MHVTRTSHNYLKHTEYYCDVEMFADIMYPTQCIMYKVAIFVCYVLNVIVQSPPLQSDIQFGRFRSICELQKNILDIPLFSSINLFWNSCKLGSTYAHCWHCSMHRLHWICYLKNNHNMHLNYIFTETWVFFLVRCIENKTCFEKH